MEKSLKIIYKHVIYKDMLIFHADSRNDIKMSFQQPFRAVLRGGREQRHQILLFMPWLTQYYIWYIEMGNLTFYLNPIIQNKDVLIDRWQIDR